MKKILCLLGSLILAVPASALAVSCGAGSTSVVNSDEVKSTNNSGGFQFSIKNVKLDRTYEFWYDLNSGFGCFDKKSKELVTDIRSSDGQRTFYKNKKYNFLITVYLFNDSGHDHDVHETIYFGSKSKDGKLKNKIAQIKIDHKAKTEPAFTLKNARVVFSKNNDYQNFTIVPDADTLKTPYGARDKNIKLQAVLKDNSNKEISNPAIESVDSLNNNGWDMKVKLKSPIELKENTQTLSFKLNKSDNKTLNILNSETNTLLIPAKGPEIIDAYVLPDIYGGASKAIEITTANITDDDPKLYSVTNNGKKLSIVSCKRPYDGSSTLDIQLDEPIQDGEIIVAYTSPSGQKASRTFQY